MKYYIDTEFHEYEKSFPFCKTFPTIELISIGIVSEVGKEYYAVSKDFDVKAAWNSHQLELNKHYPQGTEYFKKYWLRENVLRPIFEEFLERARAEEYRANQCSTSILNIERLSVFKLKNFKTLLKRYGKTRAEINKGILEYTGPDVFCGSCFDPEFYAYFADYDWVVFCWLFGKMLNLPDRFPMYCMDLKQMMQERGLTTGWKQKHCPDSINEHNALADARWNRRLHKSLMNFDKLKG